MTDLSPDVEALLDKSYESDLTEEESEELLLLCGHGIGPKLSPATHAVLDAYTDAPMSGRIALAAALRTAADQVVPGDGSRRANEIRADFLAIAAELDPQETAPTSREDRP